MFGFLFVAIVLVFIAMLAMKVVPAYIEFFSVKKILATMGQEGDIKTKTNGQIRDDFIKRANVGYVTVVKPDDLIIERKNGVPIVTADYEFRTALIGNVSLVIDFKASSDPNATAAADVE